MIFLCITFCAFVVMLELLQRRRLDEMKNQTSKTKRHDIRLRHFSPHRKAVDGKMRINK